MTVIYDNAFNINEWFVIISIVAMGFVIWITPKIFSTLQTDSLSLSTWIIEK